MWARFPALPVTTMPCRDSSGVIAPELGLAPSDQSFMGNSSSIQFCRACVRQPQSYRGMGHLNHDALMTLPFRCFTIVARLWRSRWRRLSSGRRGHWQKGTPSTHPCVYRVALGHAFRCCLNSSRQAVKVPHLFISLSNIIQTDGQNRQNMPAVPRQTSWRLSRVSGTWRRKCWRVKASRPAADQNGRKYQGWFHWFGSPSGLVARRYDRALRPRSRRCLTASSSGS